jgi:hypothetical protein
MMYIQLNKIFPFLLLTFPIIVDAVNGYLKGTDGSGDSLLGILYRGIIILFSVFTYFVQDIPIISKSCFYRLFSYPYINLL